MYLSRLMLDGRSRRVQRELAEPYEMHRSIMRAFADSLREGEERILWRVDPHPRHGLVLLVQSRSKPDWSWTEKEGGRQYLAPTGSDPAIEIWQPRYRLSHGQVHGFKLLANPTVKRRFTITGDHKRIGIDSAEDQVAWLRRKADRGGFRVIRVRATREDTVKGTILREGAQHLLHLVAVRFEGSLVVEDPGRLKEALAQGVGSGKGMGFGLLSLEPSGG